MIFIHRSWRLVAVALLLASASCKKTNPGGTPTPVTPPVVRSTQFKNPLLSSGPDPWVYQKDGYYYYMNTTGGDLQLRKTAKMSELNSAFSKVIWSPPTSGPNSKDVWAPEIHFLDGKWYVYFTAGPGNCCGGQRTWVLENTAADPTTGTWVEKGRIYNPTEDYWAIDGTVMEQNGKRYFLWSGQDGQSTVQRLYISEMSNPWTLTGPRVELSHPEYEWEKNGEPDVNEGPEVIQHGGKTFLVYSASHCDTDDYALGMLTASSTADPMKLASWTKSATPVFTKNAASEAYGPGHNGFFKSKDGQEDWIIYHANAGPNQRCGNQRVPRMQKFGWNPDGTPNFGTPVSLNVLINKPSGE
ncbi:glycoside hydrolase family 43 protein [Hymenobacter jejuensis]|uniref:Glycosyl hydrolase family 43 n=1 Tax=Hymenobacter jejuensis TaxID=2502781 RepID=A0A5B7ZXF6_9BACT|nr:glycoside hydrolase family 43 protein [Hymenobacter jejuensis]QDA59668.1 glycosyl hydrolase family 43 [Hymenobacter jejuensis]